MKIVHLIQYHLGGGRKKKGGKGGQTPAPQLPNAGKPYVESVSYDKDAKKVRLRAQNVRAGEVKTPLGDWQEFPIEIPEPTPLPDAGKPRVSKFDYDPTTRKVTVQASVLQAGEVKTPQGEEQTFDLPAEETPAVKGVVYMYRMSNRGENEDVWTDTDTIESVTVNGETYYTRGLTSFDLPEGGFGDTHCVVCSRVKPMPATGIGDVDYVPLSAHRPERLKYEKEAYVSVSSEGYIVITRNVTVL